MKPKPRASKVTGTECQLEARSLFLRFVSGWREKVVNPALGQGAAGSNLAVALVQPALGGLLLAAGAGCQLPWQQQNVSEQRFIVRHAPSFDTHDPPPQANANTGGHKSRLNLAAQIPAVFLHPNILPQCHLTQLPLATDYRDTSCLQLHLLCA